MNPAPKRRRPGKPFRARVPSTTLLPPPQKPGSNPAPRRWIETAWASHEDALRARFGGTDKRWDLRKPQRVSEVRFPLLRDDLSSVEITGHYVHHGSARARHLGRVRLDANASVEESTALAAIAAWKHALVRLPYSGGSVALRVDPASLSGPERERALRRLARELRTETWLSSATLAPGADLDDLAALSLVDELQRRQESAPDAGRASRETGLAAVVPPRGIGAEEALRIIVREALQSRATELRGARVAIHGYGEQGRRAAASLSRAGARIVAVTEGGISYYHPNGIDPAILPELNPSRGVLRIEGMLTLPGATLFTVPCDALVLTRPVPRLTPTMARRFATKLVVEADDALLPPEADALLARNRIVVVPDLLGALGPEVLHHFAWRQRMDVEAWTKRETLAQLEDFLQEAYWRSADVAARDGTMLRRAAHQIAAERFEPSER